MTTPTANPNTSEATGSVFDKYRNPDPRCGYPFEPCGAGYCWSFAHYVDGTKGYEDMEKICPGCDLFTPNDKVGEIERLRHALELIRDGQKEAKNTNIVDYIDAVLTPNAMQHAASSFDDTLERHRQWMNEWLSRFEAAVEKAKRCHHRHQSCGW